MRKQYSLFITLFIIVFLQLAHLSAVAQAICNNIVCEEVKSAIPPLSIHCLTVNPKEISLRLVPANDHVFAIAPVSTIAQGVNASAAINTTFFHRNDGSDFMPGVHEAACKIDGTWITDPWPGLWRGALGWNKDGSTIIIGRIQMRWWLDSEGVEFPISRLNQLRTTKNCVLYTDRVGTTPEHNGGLDIIIEHNHITNIIAGTGHIAVPKKGFVYSVSPECARTIPIDACSVGKKITIHHEIIPHTPDDGAPETWEHVDYVTTGLGLLVRNNQPVADGIIEGASPSFIHQQHPRTAVGILPDGKLLFVVVDGRQPHHSLGMTLDELANLMIAKGCHTALNFDGGGSSTLVINNKVANIPSGDPFKGELPGTERPTCEALCFLPRASLNTQ